MPIARIIGLCISLAVVVYGILSLNNKSLEKSSIGALFVSQSFDVDPNKTSSQNWTWCHTRVKSLKWTDLKDESKNFLIHQEKLKWMVDIGEKINMSTVSMELWLAKNCTVPLEAMPDTPITRVDFELQIDYLDSKRMNLSFSEAGSLMSWEGKTYKSPVFLDALLQLPNPPQDIKR